MQDQKQDVKHHHSGLWRGRGICVEPNVFHHGMCWVSMVRFLKKIIGNRLQSNCRPTIRKGLKKPEERLPKEGEEQNSNYAEVLDQQNIVKNKDVTVGFLMSQLKWLNMEDVKDIMTPSFSSHPQAMRVVLQGNISGLCFFLNTGIWGQINNQLKCRNKKSH